jgi:hypothetical protein
MVNITIGGITRVAVAIAALVIVDTLALALPADLSLKRGKIHLTCVLLSSRVTSSVNKFLLQHVFQLMTILNAQTSIEVF